MRFDEPTRTAIRSRLDALSRRALTQTSPRAAVLVPLCHEGGQASILFTKRTDTVGTHKGQVSFPGGRMDDDDKDEVDCALRELEEELGIDRSRVEVLGRFHEVMSITGVRVTPVIAFIDDVTLLTPAPAEIEAVFTLSIEDLLDPRKCEMRPLRSGMRGPFYTAGPHPVWGLTAFILDDVLRDALALTLPNREVVQ